MAEKNNERNIKTEKKKKKSIMKINRKPEKGKSCKKYRKKEDAMNQRLEWNHKHGKEKKKGGEKGTEKQEL